MYMSEFSTIALLSQHSESVFDFSRVTLISGPWGMISRFTFCPVPIGEYRCEFSDNNDGYSDRSHFCCHYWWIFKRRGGLKRHGHNFYFLYYGFGLSGHVYSCLSLWINVRCGPRLHASSGQRVNKSTEKQQTLVVANHLNVICNAVYLLRLDQAVITGIHQWKQV